MDQYKVFIQYHNGKRSGQIITIEGIDDLDIMEILGEITQDQLANAEIMITSPNNSVLNYEDFLIKNLTETKHTH